MPYANFVLPSLVGAGLVFGWILALWLERRHDRGSSASSDELLDELETATTPRRSMEIRTSPEGLPALLDCIQDQIDTGFGPRQSRQLARRIRSHRHRGIRSALFLIRVNGVRCDLDFHWTRDAEDRIRLMVLAVPKIIRALRRHLKAGPRLAAEGSPAVPQSGDFAPSGGRFVIASDPAGTASRE
jgi:hypothetical protein